MRMGFHLEKCPTSCQLVRGFGIRRLSRPVTNWQLVEQARPSTKTGLTEFSRLQPQSCQILSILSTLQQLFYRRPRPPPPPRRRSPPPPPRRSPPPPPLRRRSPPP